MKAIMAEPDMTQDLVGRAKAGDRAAFDALVTRFRARLVDSVQSWSRFQLGPRLDVEEVSQETFVRAFRSLESFRWQDDDAFFRWLCGIAKRVVAQAAQESLKKAARETGGSKLAGIAASGPSQSKIQQRDERFDRLERCLDRLPSEYRQVLLLSRVEGLTIRDIAERMERSSSTVKYYLACALRELKESFGETESFHLPDRRFEMGGPQDEEV